jgi:hypothetical protein
MTYCQHDIEGAAKMAMPLWDAIAIFGNRFSRLLLPKMAMPV